jgi:hypothetical protein
LAFYFAGSAAILAWRSFDPFACEIADAPFCQARDWTRFPVFALLARGSVRRDAAAERTG